jgi:hypothetical protein
LVELGAEVVELPIDEDSPDGCFVDDCAVIADGGLPQPPGSTPGALAVFPPSR